MEKVLKGKSDIFDEGVCGKNVKVLILIMCWLKVWGGGGVSGSYWILGEGFVGLIGQIFSALVLKNVVPELCSLWSL